jgi:hypothetical protein
MSTTVTVLAWIGLALGLLVELLVVVLFNRVVRPLREIDRYAGDILDAGLGIARNVDGADELLRTRDLVRTVPGLAVGYLQKLGSVPR